MSNIRRTLIGLGLLGIVFLVWLQPISFGRTDVSIPEGATAREIAEHLAQQGVVRDKEEFILWLRISGKEKGLKSGIYTLPKYRNPLYVINALLKGGRSDVIVTVPEGLTLYEIADILDINGLINKDTFIKLCHDTLFIRGVGYARTSFEGYLFPDTYSFSRTQSDSQIIMDFVHNFERHIKNYMISDSDSIHRILILASLVEKEAKIQEERPIIARVFLNRLKANRPLESCATVFYALRKIDHKKYGSKTQLTKQDLKFVSPYNTYINLGLPPGPICSPGESSISAVVRPADVDYLYFVAKGNGQHHFSRTFQEHVAAKEKYHAKK